MSTILNYLLNFIECPICYEQIETAYNCNNCTNLICKKCFNNWYNNYDKNFCPVCGKIFNLVFKDLENKAFTRFIKNLPKKCKYNKNGCRYANSKADLVTHEFSCKYKKKKSRSQHLKNKPKIIIKNKQKIIIEKKKN